MKLLRESKQKLIELGFDLQSLNKAIYFALMELADDTIALLEKENKRDLLEAYVRQLNSKKISIENKTGILAHIIDDYYGNNADSVRLEYINNYFQSLIDIIESNKDLFEKYRQGDSNIVSLVTKRMKELYPNL